MKSKISRIALMLSLTVCMMASMLVLNANAEEAATDNNAECSTIFEPYTAEEASEYLAGDDTYPAKDGYVFGGWYTTNELPEDVAEASQYAVRSSVPEDTTTVFALFVPEDVLKVKAQVSVHLIDNEVTSKDNKAVIRFVTTVDSLLYREVGFEISYTSIAGKEQKAVKASNEVYATLYEADTNNVWEVTPQEEFCGVSTYFKACTVKNVPIGFYKTVFTVKPYWITMSGDKVYGESANKSITEGCVRDEVYVSSTSEISKDKPQYGTSENPYASLDYAIAHVKDNGTVRIKDSLTVPVGSTWTAHGKNITITGDGDVTNAETLDFYADGSTPNELYVNDSVTFSDLNVKFADYVFANGNSLKVSEDVNVTSAKYIYGGGKTDEVENTNLELYAGSYTRIYGGAHNGDVVGNTRVVIGGNINPNAEYTNHSARNHQLFGGCRMGTVKGDTNVIVQEGAKVEFVYGGGGYYADSNVEGATHVEFAGLAYGVFGGSFKGTNADTNLKMTGGEAYQVFGGNEGNSMTGDANVQILGGKVYRRIYGGCYNNYDLTNGWTTSDKVTGTISVTIGTTVDLNQGTDNALCALSRSGAPFEGETGVLIFQNDLYSSLSSKVSNLSGDHAYNYLVKASVDGEAYMAGDNLVVVPDSGKKALVKLDSASGEVVYYAEKESSCALPELVDSVREIYVTFPETVETNVNITIADSENGTVASECASYPAGALATLTVTPNEGYYCKSLTVMKDGVAVALNPEFVPGQETYTFDTEAGEYTVEASFAQQVFKYPEADNTYTLWNVIDQCQSVETLENGGTKITGTVYATDIQEKDKTDSLAFVGKYTNMDLTVNAKDDPSTTAGIATPGTTITLAFEGYSYQVRAVKNGDNIVLRVVAGMSKNTNMYTFTEEQAAKFASAEGVDVRMVRFGTEVYLYVDGTYAYKEDLATLSDVVTADTEMSVNIKRFGDTGTAVAIPFIMINKVDVVKVNVGETTNGTVTTDDAIYEVGETATITVAPKSGYYCNSLIVKKDGEAIELDKELSVQENTYSFVVEDATYTVEATFIEKVFTTPTSETNTSWNLMTQNESMETLSNGGTKVTGTVYATDLQLKDKTDALAFVGKYTDMDLTVNVKDDPSTAEGSTTPGTTLTLAFEGYSYQVRAVKNSGNIVLRVVAGMSKNTNMYTFTEEQAAKFTSAEGVDVRMVRLGTEVYLYVDGTYAYKEDLATLSDVVTADTEMSVNIKRFGDTGTAVAIPFTMIDKLSVAKVDVSETTNGTVTADDVLYEVGETATLTVTPDSGYYCNSLTVEKDGEAVTLDKELNMTDTTYSFVVEEATYTVEATFVEKVFTTPSVTYTSWNLMNQNESMETLANGGTKITGTVYATDLQLKDKMDNLSFVNKYTEMDLTYVAKDDPSTTEGSTTPGTQVVLDFDGYSYQVRAVKNSGNIVLRVVAGMSANTNMYTFTTEQAEKFASADGVEIRMVRYETVVAFYVDGTFAYSANLSELNSIVTADREMKVSIKRFGDTNVAVAIPFTVIDKVSPAVKVQETTNGTASKDKVLYEVGETATLTVTPDSGYYCNSLTVKKDGEVIALDKELNITDTTYSFVVEDAIYTVEATFVEKVFKTPTSETKTVWDIMKQNESMETLANGGTKITGTVYSTCLLTTDGTDALAFANKFTDMDLSLKVKDDPSTTSGNATPGTTVTLDFSSYIFQVRAVKNGDNIVLRVLNGLSAKTNVYTFTSTQADKFATSEGVDFRVVRSGTELYLYVDGTLAYTLDLAAKSVELGKTEVTETTNMSVNIRRYGDQNTAVAIPFSVADKVTPVAVEVYDDASALVANDSVAADVQNIHLTSNETYSVKLTAQGLESTGYFKITYVDHVTNEIQSVYTPAVAAGESFEFTYQNGVFDAETEAEIATVLWENRIKATKDVLTVEVISGALEGDTISAGAVVGREPMSKPASVTVSTNWTLGSAVSASGEMTENAAYAYTDVITVAKKGTKLSFTDSVKTDSWATGDVFVVSSWKQDENEAWVIDTEGTNIAGQYTTGEITCTEGYEVFIERYGTDSITYTYITSEDNETIRFCYYAGEGTTSFPKITSTYSGETGTAVEIALAADTAEWIEDDKTRAYYSIFEGKTISVIGDSYMAGSSIANTANVWVNMFATKYGMTMNNHGVNGSTISNYAGATYNPMVDRWETDFANDTPDIIIVEGGRNDYNQNTPMGELGTTDKGTMKGATTYLISSLKEKYPNAIIIGISCWEVGGNRNAAGYYCSDYGRAFIEVCENLGIPYVNAMDSEAMDVYMTSSNFRGRFCIKAGDISHLNEKGMKLVLPVFEEKIYDICK